MGETAKGAKWRKGRVGAVDTVDQVDGVDRVEPKSRGLLSATSTRSTLHRPIAVSPIRRFALGRLQVFRVPKHKPALPAWTCHRLQTPGE